MAVVFVNLDFSCSRIVFPDLVHVVRAASPQYDLIAVLRFALRKVHAHVVLATISGLKLDVARIFRHVKSVCSSRMARPDLEAGSPPCVTIWDVKAPLLVMDASIRFAAFRVGCSCTQSLGGDLGRG